MKNDFIYYDLKIAPTKVAGWLIPKLIAALAVIIYVFTVMLPDSPLQWLTKPLGIFWIAEVIFLALGIGLNCFGRPLGIAMIWSWIVACLGYCFFACGAIFATGKITAIANSFVFFSDYAKELSFPLFIHLLFLVVIAHALSQRYSPTRS